MTQPMTKPSAAAYTSLVYITVGALMDVWSGIWYWYLSNHRDTIRETTMYWCYGFLLTGLTSTSGGAAEAPALSDWHHADAATQAVLKQAISETHAWFMDRLVTYGERFWPDAKWDVLVPPIAATSGFTFEAADYFDVDARGIGYFSFCAPPKKLCAATVYFGAFFDGHGQQLRQ